MLFERVEALEAKQKPSIADMKKSIVQYALRPSPDFDKYKVLEMIGLENTAASGKDKKLTTSPRFSPNLWKGLRSPKK